jgi:hypothetical protein
MGKSQRRKGVERERQLVRKLRDEGIEAERVGVAYASGHDIDLFPYGREVGALPSELKARKNGEGFKQIESWLSDNDILFLWRDRRDPLAVLPWDVLIRLFKAARRP